MGREVTTRSEPSRVLIFEDAPRQTAQLMDELSRAGITVVGAATTIDEMHTLVTTVPFHVAILDSLAGETAEPLGLRIGLWLRKYRPDVGVLIFTSDDSEYNALRLLQAGAHGAGYLVKNRGLRTEDLVHAISTVRHRRNVLDARIRAALLPLQDSDHPAASSHQPKYKPCG
jgi:DNA-binding NarL/FixJ family response regulator